MTRVGLIAALIAFSAASALGGEGEQIRILELVATDFMASGRTPHVGDPFYSLWIHYEVVRPPPGSIDILMSMGGQSSTWKGAPRSVGRHAGWLPFDSGLDGGIPYKAEVVAADGTGGEAEVAASASGTFQPIPPADGIELYDPKRVAVRQSRFMTFKSGGIVGRMLYLFGVPSETATQREIADYVPPEGSERLAFPRGGVAAYLVRRLGHDAAEEPTFERGHSFKATLYSCRVNPKVLGKVSWDDLSRGLPESAAYWRRSEKLAPTDHPFTAEFVRRHLGKDYRRDLNPFEAAKRLYLGVIREMKYGEASKHQVIQDSVADGATGTCGLYSFFYVTLLRHIGFAARVSGGFWQGEGRTPGDQPLYHMLAEFYVPGFGWVPADPAMAESKDPTGRFAYYFGNTPYTNTLCSVTHGGSHDWPGFGFADHLQVPYWIWDGGADLATSGCGVYNRIAEPLQIQLPLPRVDARRPSYAHVEVAAPAGPEPLRVGLSSSDPRVIVPSEVSIPPGGTWGMFTIEFKSAFQGEASLSARARGHESRARLRCYNGSPDPRRLR